MRLQRRGRDDLDGLEPLDDGRVPAPLRVTDGLDTEGLGAEREEDPKEPRDDNGLPPDERVERLGALVLDGERLLRPGTDPPTLREDRDGSLERGEKTRPARPPGGLEGVLVPLRLLGA